MRRNLAAAATAFGNPSAASASSNSTCRWRFVIFDEIAIDDPQPADAGASQRIGRRRSRAPRSRRSARAQPPSRAAPPRRSAGSAFGGRIDRGVASCVAGTLRVPSVEWCERLACRACSGRISTAHGVCTATLDANILRNRREGPNRIVIGRRRRGRWRMSMADESSAVNEQPAS